MLHIKDPLKCSLSLSSWSPPLAGSAPTHMKDSSQTPPHSLPAPWRSWEGKPSVGTEWKSYYCILCLWLTRGSSVQLCFPKKSRSPQHRRHVEEEVSVQLWRWGWVIIKAVKCRFLSTQLEWWFHFSESTLRANRVIVTLWPGGNRVKGFKPPQCPVRKV